MVVGTQGTERGQVFDLILASDVASEIGTAWTNTDYTRGFGNHHGITIPPSTAPGTEIGLMLFDDPENDRPSLEEIRLPPLPIPQPEANVDFRHSDPTTELIFAQDNWSDGGFQWLYDPEKPNRYTKASGMDLRWGGAVPGMRLDHGQGDIATEPVVSVGFIIRDPSFEHPTLGTTWDDVGTPTATDSVTTDRRSGDNSARHARVTVDASGEGISFTVANPTVFRGREIVFSAYIKRVSGSDGVYLKILDDSTETVSSAVTSSSYTSTSVTHGVYSSASSLKFQILSNGSDITFDVDDCAVIPTGGVTCTGTAVESNDLYGIFGRLICKLNGQNGTNGPNWEAVYVHSAAAATCIEEYDGDVYVAFGTAQAYIYGSGTSWTSSTLSGTNDNAVHFATSRQSIWKNETINTIKSSTNPKNGGSWSSAYTVGSSDRQINELHAYGDTVVVGKEDGLFFYKRVYNDGGSADLFINQTSEFKGFQSFSNFAIGEDQGGWLWLLGANQQLIRTNLEAIEDWTALIASPDIDELGGDIQAISKDTNNLWLLGANGLDTTSARAWLISLRELTTGVPVHPLHEVKMDQIDFMTSHFTDRGSDGTRPMLYAMGLSSNGITSSQKTFAWFIPEKSLSPIRAATPKTNLFESYFDTPIFHGGMPHRKKAAISATIWTDGHASETVRFKFGRDGDDVDSNDGFVFSGTDRVETLYFESLAAPLTNAVANSFQFRWLFSPNDTAHTRRMYAYAIEFTLRPERVRAWLMRIAIGGAILGNESIQDDADSAKAIWNKLDTLEQQSYPILMTQDFDDDGTAEEVRVIIRPGTLRKRFALTRELNSPSYWEMVLQEKRTS
jgi:hypothetical protein